MMNTLPVAATVVAVAAAARSTWSPCGLSMLSSINPLAERAKRHHYSSTASFFVLGSVGGGATLGALMAAAAMVVRWSHLSSAGLAAAGGLLALVAAAGDAGLLGIRFPILRRQLNERWLDQYRGWVYGLGFGWQIGVGYATYVMTAGVMLMTALGVLTGSWRVALGVGVLFGLLRGSAVLITSSATSAVALRSVLEWFDRVNERSRRIVACVETAVAIGLTFSLQPALAISVGVTAVVGILVVTRLRWSTTSTS